MGARPNPHAPGVRRLSCSEEYSEFKAVSENALFAYDEGLPGKAWAAGHPVILTKFANSYFKRTDERSKLA